MDVLTWIPSQKVFLKVQEGTGDNLSQEDMAAGLVSYVLWSTFRPEDIGVDEQLDMECRDGGMLCFEEKLPQDASGFIAKVIPEVLLVAFGSSCAEGEVQVLLTSEDYEGDAV